MLRIFDIDFTRADLVWDDDFEIAIKHPRGDYLGKPDSDVFHSTRDTGVILNTTVELQQDEMGALANSDSDEAEPVSNADDMGDNSILSIASKQHKSDYIWSIAVLMVSGMTMSYLWHRHHANKKGVKKKRAASESPHSSNLATRK